MKKDYVLRLLAIAAFFIAFFFSFVTEIKDKSGIALIWGCASLIYWYLVWEFEGRNNVEGN